MSSLKSPRIEIIDALRGFALAGILICHMVEQYIGAAATSEFYEATNLSVADQIVNAFIGIFLRGKFIALFSFLFGLSFFIQMNNASKKGIGYGGRFLWRLVLLFAIGFLHSLFYRGDILTVYALLGVFLIPFYKLNNKWVLAVAAILFFGFGRFIIFYFTKGNHLFLEVESMNIEAPSVLEYYQTIKEGSLLDVFEINAWEGHLDKMNFQLGTMGRGYFTFAFFLIGLFVGRAGFFERFEKEKKLIRKVLIWSGVTLVLAIGVTAAAFISLGQGADFNNWLAMVGFTGGDIINMALTFIYIALFATLYRKLKPQKWLAKFAPYGRMALTNYFMQSLIGTALLFGWGLGYLGELQNWHTFLLAIVLIALQMWFSKLWLQRFKYGPLEWLWRSLTFFKIFPLSKK